MWEDALELRATRRLQQYGGIVLQMRSERGPQLVDVAGDHDPFIIRSDSSKRCRELAESADDGHRRSDSRARDLVMTAVRVGTQFKHRAKHHDFLHTGCRGEHVDRSDCRTG